MSEKKVLNYHISEHFAAYHADCVEGVSFLPDDSVHFSIFSPPFASLYTYSNSDRDMGNSKSYDEFWSHFRFLIDELFRVMVPGRIVAVHCMDLPTSKQHHGVTGLLDFPGHLIDAFVKAGFIFHSRCTIFKDPVVQMQRTKAQGLLWKQLKKDSAMSRQGIPDYMVVFRKPGVNPKPIAHTAEEFPVKDWQHLASPCWMHIKQSNTLNKKLAREDQDERHIAPLQLDLIEDCLRLWSIPGDIVLSPFMGIGSEGYVSLQMGRKFVGFELKKSYYECATANLASVKFGGGTGRKPLALVPADSDERQLMFDIHQRDRGPS